MARYLVRRVLQAIVVLLVVTLVIFLLLQLLPGGAARALLGPKASQAAIRVFNRENGYDEPVFVQYVAYLGRLLHGNLGFSLHYNQSVTTLIATALPKSALLVGLAYLFGVLIAIPVGLFQAVKRNRAVDYVLSSSALIGYSMPTFWLGLVLIEIFAVKLQWLPGEGPQGATIQSVVSDPVALVLPVATLTIVTVAWFSRYVRSSAVQALVDDYIRTAKAKGVAPKWVLVRHVLPNALLPVITLLGLSLPSTVAGAIVTESVFNYPGMGLLFWTATLYRDYPVLLGCMLIIAVATVVGSLVADILYAVADPRIRYA